MDHSEAEEAPVAARRQIDRPRGALPLRRGAGAGAALHDAVAEDVHRPRVGPAGDDARVVLRRRLYYLPRVGRRRRRGLAAAAGAEGQPRALVLDAELDAAVQGARPDQRGRRRRREDDPLLLLVAAVQRVREAVVVPRPPRPAALAGADAVRAWRERRRRVEHGRRAHGEGHLGLGVPRGALGEGEGAGGQGGRVQQPRGGEQGSCSGTLAAGGVCPGPATVAVAWNGRRARGLIGDVAPLRAGAVH